MSVTINKNNRKYLWMFSISAHWYIRWINRLIDNRDYTAQNLTTFFDVLMCDWCRLCCALCRIGCYKVGLSEKYWLFHKYLLETWGKERNKVRSSLFKACRLWNTFVWSYCAWYQLNYSNIVCDHFLSLLAR